MLDEGTQERTADPLHPMARRHGDTELRGPFVDEAIRVNVSAPHPEQGGTDGLAAVVRDERHVGEFRMGPQLPQSGARSGGIPIKGLDQHGLQKREVLQGG